jgi:hypothetical protein
MADVSVEQKFTRALDALVDQVKADRSVLAAILCGSLSHDTVWAKSDIDLMLVTVDEKKPDRSHLSLFADGVNVHATLLPRATFRKAVEGALDQSFVRALLAKGRLLYTHDETIAELCDRARQIGDRDSRLALFEAATSAVGCLYKAHKWLVTRGDLDYTALWILYAATPLAEMEVIAARLIADREVIPQAMRLNPAFFKTVYSDLLNAQKTPELVRAALQAADGYLAPRAAIFFSPVVDYLREAGEARSATEIEDHFTRNFGIAGATMACEYLSDQGLIGKASTPVRLTKRSNVDVQELAFFSPGEAPRASA